MKDPKLFELDLRELEESVERVKKGLEKAGETAYNAAKKEMINIIFDILGEAMRRAPVDQGTLRGSGLANLNGKQVAHTENTAESTARLIKDFKAGSISLNKLLKEINGEVVFNTPYATLQHEELEFEHPKGGEAKYLENILKEKSPEYIKGLADAVDRALDKEGGFR